MITFFFSFSFNMSYNCVIQFWRKGNLCSKSIYLLEDMDNASLGNLLVRFMNDFNNLPFDGNVLSILNKCKAFLDKSNYTYDVYHFRHRPFDVPFLLHYIVNVDSANFMSIRTFLINTDLWDSRKFLFLADKSQCIGNVYIDLPIYLHRLSSFHNSTS